LFVFFNRGIVVFLPWLLLAFLLTFVFVCGLGLLFSVTNVFFRDFGNLLGVILMFWLWVTPVFYSHDMVPEEFRWVCDVNPMTPLVTFYRDVLFWARPPQWGVVAAASLWACASLFLGLAVFSRLEAQLLKRL
jgi:lipopolysaccharide transport system permease protein